MNAYQKQQRIKEAIGVKEIKRIAVVGNKATWHVTMLDGFVNVIEANRLSSETGVLTTLKGRLERARAAGQ